MERSPRSRKTTGTSKSTTGKSHKQGMSGKSSKPLLEKYFLEELKDIYWAEKHLTKALPKMQKAATSDELANAFADHLAITEDQVGRLEDVFEMLGETPRAKKCDAMEGLVSEAQTIIEETEDGSATRDVALIMAAQKVEHYEIATYGGLTQLAKTLGRDDIAGLLGQTLQEEKETDELLTSIAENNSNITASEEGHEGEQNEEEE